MPTPSETTLPPSPRSELPSRASFTSCPPDEDRDAYMPRDARRDDTSGPTATPQADAQETNEHAIAQQPTPEPESRSRTADSAHVDEPKGDHAEDIGVASDGISMAASSPEPGAEGEQPPEPSVLPTAHPAQYLDIFPIGHRPHPNSTSSFLRPGSRFHGTQRSDRQVYDVQVEIKDADMAESFLCGYLRIQGLTDDHPTLTTFFEGEIIGPKYLFKTTHPTWGSTEKVDLQHWARFPAWRPLAKSAKSPNFTLKNYQQREHLFMRWKEYFLVPDHRVKTITGASFEGFYYICFNQCDGRVSGIYFHAKSEKYQQLELQHVEDHGCAGAMEFR